MKRVLSMIPAILIFCVLGFGISNKSISIGENDPQTPPRLRSAQAQGGLYTYDSPFEGDLISYSPFEGGQGDVKTNNPIKIGLLIQTSTSSEARNGASLAIDEANKKGGFNGRKFELVVKSMEGPWGTGSKQAVDLIFKDEVIAIVGSHDGRNAHLVEQATTKSNVCFVSAWAGDPSLSQAFTPWFFNCVPNDNQQADMLMPEIAGKKYSVLTLITDEDYDAGSAFRSFSAKTQKAGTPRPVAIVLDKAESEISEMVKMIISRKTDCLGLFTEPASAGRIICRLKELKYPLQIYGPLSLLKDSSPVYNYPEVLKNVQLLTSGDWFMKMNSEFAVRYCEKYNSWPEAAAAYSYDAVNIIINAVLAVHGDRDKIQKAIMSSDYHGATGTIKFDERGNRIYRTGKRE